MLLAQWETVVDMEVLLFCVACCHATPKSVGDLVCGQ